MNFIRLQRTVKFDKKVTRKIWDSLPKVKGVKGQLNGPSVHLLQTVTFLVLLDSRLYRLKKFLVYEAKKLIALIYMIEYRTLSMSQSSF